MISSTPLDCFSVLNYTITIQPEFGLTRSLIAKNITFKEGKNKKGKILLCGKSSCSKRGEKQLYRALTATLQKLGLQERVNIELTGCQKQCKKAPSLILMPGKVKQAYVNPHNLALLLTAHYL